MDLLRNMRLSRRLAALIALFSLGLLLYGAWSFKTLEEFKVNGPLYREIVQGKDLIADILPPPEYIIESYLVVLQLSETDDRTEQDKLVERLKALKGDYETRHRYWVEESFGDESRELFLKTSYAPAENFYAIAFKEFIPAVQSQDKNAAAAAMSLMREAYEAHRKAIDQVVDIMNKHAGRDEAAAKERLQFASWLLLAILAASLGVGIAGAALISRSITRPLDDAVNAAQIVSAGDLTHHLEVRFQDEPGLLLKALSDMNSSLSTIISQVRASAHAISLASGEIASGNLDLSTRTEQQAASLEEAASSIEELTSAVRQNADNAMQANQLVARAAEFALKGGHEVGDVVGTMNGIKESSHQIAEIIAVIDGIAFQTNILALNAAVEAARAGEQGRGFAVVAAEVRHLAQRSASAAKDIKSLITDSVEKVETGSKLVEAAGGTMTQIVQSVRQVKDLIGEIAAAGKEQSAGIDQVNRSVAQMDEMTQQNAALVEQAAAAAHSMNEQAERLIEEMSIFTLGKSNAPAMAVLSSAHNGMPASVKAPHLNLPRPASNTLSLVSKSSTKMA